MKFIFLAHLFSTLFMTGVIWFAQIVHYPLLGRVGKDAFVEYERENTWRTGWVVIPVMAVELITALLLLWRPPEGVLPVYLRLNGILLAAIWVSTFSLQGPYHHRLVEKFDPAVWRSLVSTNWIRTAAWTARGILLLFAMKEVCS
ncbi:MAG: hypothetical protein HXY45_14195 [Syntrophaceae bacterium]|nr:hypothetical protein [Syntrophaceae bacterium]